LLFVRFVCPAAFADELEFAPTPDLFAEMDVLFEVETPLWALACVCARAVHDMRPLRMNEATISFI
jgi:hypothetical protein